MKLKGTTTAFRRSALIVTLTVVLCCCTKLKEDFKGDLTSAQVAADSANTAALLQGVYNSLDWPFCSYLNLWTLDELTTDAAIAPTRGQDWDDNGAWRVLHTHKWDGANVHMKEVFESLNGINFLATDMLRYHPTPRQEAEARFLRAVAMYFLLDLYNQVPYRDPGESTLTEARVYKGMEAWDFIISEINWAEPKLPDGPAGVANQFACKALLMKCYLNKAVYAARPGTSFTFDQGDMDKVISLADEIINSGKFFFSVNYFDNFAPANTDIGHENIFTQFHQGGMSANNAMPLSFVVTLHYANTPGGANGFTTLSDYYDRFEANDIRRGIYYTTIGSPPNPGKRNNIGFLIGQQYNWLDDSQLFTGSGLPVAFTREVQNIETGSNLEVTGIRALKYEPDWNNLGNPDNDLVIFRLADVLLMKAEAILRGGQPTDAGIYGNSPTKIVNTIRTDPGRNASPIDDVVTLPMLLEERGRELWWEGWRRQDMIRFGTFLDKFQQKDEVSDPHYLIFAIPNQQLAVNHNLVQNPGY